MTSERNNPSPQSRFAEVFGFTRQEELYNRITDRRFQTLLEDKTTTVHNIEESYNNYGEWLFVTVSRGAGDQRILATFYGCGYHEYRERWFTEEWFYYRANPNPEMLERQLSQSEVNELLEQRRRAIRSYVQRDTQSKRGQLFEMLAELTDDDGALIEMEDMGEDAIDWLSGDLPE